MNPFSEDNLVAQTVIKLIKDIWANEVCYIKEGLSNILVADKFCAFIRRKYQDILQQLTSFEDFLQLQKPPKT